MMKRPNLKEFVVLKRGFRLPRISLSWAFAIIIAVTSVLIGLILVYKQSSTDNDLTVASIDLSEGSLAHQKMVKQKIADQKKEIQTLAEKHPSSIKPESKVLDDIQNKAQESSTQKHKAQKNKEQEPISKQKSAYASRLDEMVAEMDAKIEKMVALEKSLLPPEDEETVLTKNTPETPIISKPEIDPFVVYNHDYIADPKKIKLSIVVTEIGFDLSVTHYILETLPEVTTCAVLPSGELALESVTMIRSRGHEYLVMLPMEPMDFPHSNPGDHTLLTNVSPVINLRHIELTLSPFKDYMGVMAFMGNRLARSEVDFSPLLVDFQKRGLCYFEPRFLRSGTSMWRPQKLPYAKAQFDLPRRFSQSEIQKKLDQAYSVLEKGQNVIITVNADIVTLKALSKWLERGLPESVELVPLSLQMSLPQDRLDNIPLHSEDIATLVQKIKEKKQ